jgi:hypothetical protein
LCGRKFLETFVEHWPCKILVYYESLPDFKHEKVEYRNLFDVHGLTSFLTLIQDKPMCKGNLAEGYNYNFDIWKFCRKSFAQFDALNHKGKVIWLDSDIETHKDVTVEWIDNLFEDTGLVFLGREGFHTETGFIGFNTEVPDFERFLSKYVNVYRHGIIFSLKKWHDCEAFDWARSFKQVKEKNLSPNWKFEIDSLDVFGNSVLSEYMTHHKGIRKFGVQKLFNPNEVTRSVQSPSP